ncbi:hypothetical protein MSIBF_A1950004 [groundwater metagenome]|uniref:Uncharacterized protein n=1 Tax=groundwater metagenome TaxID=717931 RepID=A0A098E9B1_9ZZZZ
MFITTLILYMATKNKLGADPGLFNIEDILNCSSFHFLI